MNIYRVIHRAPPVKVHLIQAAACISIYILKYDISNGAYGICNSTKAYHQKARAEYFLPELSLIHNLLCNPPV